MTFKGVAFMNKNTVIEKEYQSLLALSEEMKNLSMKSQAIEKQIELALLL